MKDIVAIAILTQRRKDGKTLLRPRPKKTKGSQAMTRMPPATVISNFGTLPHMLPTHIPTKESWWADPVSEAEFYERAKVEAQRMIGSKGARMCLQMAITNLADWQ